MARKSKSFEGAPAFDLAPPVGPVRAYEHRDRMGDRCTWSFDSVGIKAVADELALYLGPSCAELFEGNRWSSVSACDHAWRALGRRLRAANFSHTVGLAALTVADINHIDRPGNATQVASVITTLRVIDRANPSLLSADVKRRLRKISRHKRSSGKRREPLEAELAAQLLIKADEGVRDARDRIDAGQRRAMELRARDSLSEADELRLKLVDGARPTRREADIVKGWGEKTSDYSRSSLMTMADGICFLFAIGLRVEMPIECLRGLRRNCLKRTTGKHVWVEYTKGRGGNAERTKMERVPDGGITTPGGLIRLALRLTKPAADRLAQAGHPDKDLLWVGFVTKGEPSWRGLALRWQDFRRTVTGWRVTNSKGDLVDGIAPSCLRKTVKVASYRRKRGHLGRFATDNSRGVAARHYAAVDDLAQEHALTLETAERRLLESAMSPTVITPEEETAVRAGAIGLQGRSYSPASAAKLLDGEHDTHLGICLDFWAGPVRSNPDGTCATPFTLCLHCRNAVFTKRKLVALCTLLAWIEDQRSLMGHNEWLVAYGDDRARIVHQILPKFSSEDVAAARSTAAASGERPVLPPHQRHA